MSVEDDMREIARLAPLKRHRLTADMVDGRRMLAPAAARMVLTHLSKCPDKSVAEPAGPGPYRTRAGRQLTSTDVDKLAEEAERGYPVSREAGRGPVAHGKTNPPPMAAFASLANGYYATRRGDSDTIDFWLVERGTRAPWAGVMFIRRVLGGPSPDQKKPRSEKISNLQQRAAAQAITEFGPDAAQELFADAMERCLDCGSLLTNELSRSRRRGDTCYGNFMNRG